MAKLLHILASPRVESYSTRVAKAFLDSYRQARPEDHIEVLDLFQADIPPFYAPQAKAKYAVSAGQRPVTRPRPPGSPSSEPSTTSRASTSTCFPARCGTSASPIG